jgi:hypothetical protein
MEAARQKEINVSITEDATMSLTRSEGGPTVVRVDAMARVPERLPAIYIPKSAIIRGPWVSVCPNWGGVNRKERVDALARMMGKLLILAEQLFSIFDETDEYDN